LQRSAYVRFTNQLSDFEVHWPGERLASEEDLAALMKRFENVYTTIYPTQALYSEVGYQIFEVALSADIATPKPRLPELPIRGRTVPSTAEKGARKVYWRAKTIEFRILEMDAIEAGNVVNGPVIIEHPATTLLVPPE